MLEDLINQFSAETFGEWRREKFDRFTAAPHEIQDAGDFSKAAIVGYVQSLPDADTNRPLLVMCVHAGEQISERSSRRRQFDFARKQLQSAVDKPPATPKRPSPPKTCANPSALFLVSPPMTSCTIFLRQDRDA
ncbi:MAG: hypothetical protein WCR06_08450 [bacterium]